MAIEAASKSTLGYSLLHSRGKVKWDAIIRNGYIKTTF